MAANYIEQVIRFIFQIYTFMIFGYILMSWFPQMRESSIGEILRRFVEPYLRPFRSIIPPLGMIDISPIVALLALYFAEEGLISIIGFLFGG